MNVEKKSKKAKKKRTFEECTETSGNLDNAVNLESPNMGTKEEQQPGKGKKHKKEKDVHEGKEINVDRKKHILEEHSEPSGNVNEESIECEVILENQIRRSKEHKPLSKDKKQKGEKDMNVEKKSKKVKNKWTFEEHDEPSVNLDNVANLESPNTGTKEKQQPSKGKKHKKQKDVHEGNENNVDRKKHISEEHNEPSGNVNEESIECEIISENQTGGSSEHKPLSKDKKCKGEKDVRERNKINREKNKQIAKQHDEGSGNQNGGSMEYEVAANSESHMLGSKEDSLLKKDKRHKEKEDGGARNKLKRVGKEQIVKEHDQRSANLNKESVECELASDSQNQSKDKKHKKRAATSDIEGEGKKKKASRKVSFADNVEVFPSSKGPSDGENDNNEKEELVRGKRFSPEEDELVKQAVYNFIKAKGLGEDGLDMVLHCRKHPEIKDCWKEIGVSLPWRPYQSVYHRAHILFVRRGKHTWTPEEYELVRKFHDKHGSNWKALGDALGMHRLYVKDTWRRVKLPRNRGSWSEKEYQTLFDLVNMDLRMRVFEEKKSKHGMLRDNISWTAISDTLVTRNDTSCCDKWYKQLTSPMVAEGVWADSDDYRLIDALANLDACSMEDVGWDQLIEGRSGETCRKRWNQMVKHIINHGSKSFAEQVEILSKRYCPDLLEAREIYDSKPVVS